ncbi:TetR/AcrR family transcriptional regulator [Shewanella sp. JM162201]|uniref:TetR/AcrR family transcriptional regulator n=1 Tax=Shewanella jiangmenensis TaxID=2837387 RepID=A0ABS5V4I7_9GAMM|nr:TetR/AcrR family transcriptional regulator [Shewanella jiangmenensis]MBT1444716.1 TetR/AcrR family transcriptional regulator [Shewanella jiangmenensis]
MARNCNFCKEEKLEQAMNLFWQKGYEGTSVADLVEHLGINRFSLYNSFGDKLTLYRDALRRYLYTRGLTGLAALEADNAGMEALQTLVEEFAAKQKDQRFGCFMQNALLERCVEDEEVKRLGDELFARLNQAFFKVIARYQPPERASALAAFLVMQLQGIRVLGKSGQLELLDAAMVVLRGEIQRWKTPA